MSYRMTKHLNKSEKNIEELDIIDTKQCGTILGALLNEPLQNNPEFRQGKYWISYVYLINPEERKEALKKKTNNRELNW